MLNKTTPPQSSEEHNKFIEYLEKMWVLITGVSAGSLVITVECESLLVLEKLWKDRPSGHLGEVVQNYFATGKMLTEMKLEEL